MSRYDRRATCNASASWRTRQHQGTLCTEGKTPILWSADVFSYLADRVGMAEPYLCSAVALGCLGSRHRKAHSYK